MVINYEYISAGTVAGENASGAVINFDHYSHQKQFEPKIQYLDPPCVMVLTLNLYHHSTVPYYIILILEQNCYTYLRNMDIEFL